MSTRFVDYICWIHVSGVSHRRFTLLITLVVGSREGLAGFVGLLLTR